MEWTCSSLTLPWNEQAVVELWTSIDIYFCFVYPIPWAQCFLHHHQGFFAWEAVARRIEWYVISSQLENLKALIAAVPVEEGQCCSCWVLWIRGKELASQPQGPWPLLSLAGRVAAAHLILCLIGSRVGQARMASQGYLCVVQTKVSRCCVEANWRTKDSKMRTVLPGSQRPVLWKLAPTPFWGHSRCSARASGTAPQRPMHFNRLFQVVLKHSISKALWWRWGVWSSQYDWAHSLIPCLGSCCLGGLWPLVSGFSSWHNELHTFTGHHI